jgi:hypothetical protein
LNGLDPAPRNPKQGKFMVCLNLSTLKRTGEIRERLATTQEHESKEIFDKAALGCPRLTQRFCHFGDRFSRNEAMPSWAS